MTDRDQALETLRTLLLEVCEAIPAELTEDSQFVAIRTATRTAIDATRVAPDERAAMVGTPRTSLDRTIEALQEGLSRRQRELKAKIESNQRSLDLNDRLRAAGVTDVDDEPIEDDLEYIANVTAERDACSRDLEAIGRMLATIRTDPISLLLPIGSVVETTEQQVGPYTSLPVTGSIGVVVGYDPDNENVNVVSFPSRIRDNYGHQYNFDAEDECPERPPTFRYTAESLKVVEPARFWGGGVNPAPGYTPTHTHGRPGKILSGDDMLVEALGWLWRVEEINGMPERTQMTKASDPYRFDFLKPLVQAVAA